MTAASAAKREAPKVLLVDDDAFSRAVLKRRLLRLGVDVVEAVNGTAAMSLLLSQVFDLIVLDLEMPEMDGITLLSIIRGHPRLRHLPTVVITGDESRVTAERALGAGATSFLVKPLNWAVFGPHIKHLADLMHTSRVALENMAQGLALFEPGGNLVLSNELYRGMAGSSSASGDEAAPQWLSQCRHEMRADEVLERITRLPDDRSISSSFRPLPNGGWVEVHRDISEQLQANARISYLARHDSLTGLANRVEFRERLCAELARAKRGGDLAVLCVDLDYFKAVNDTLGHPVGDAVLVAVAERLREAVRETDVVARLGGDEFAVIQVGGQQPEGAGQLANRLIQDLSKTFDVDGQQMMIGASIGIALAPTDSLDPDSLLRKADLALYRAKAQGRQTYCYFEPEMDLAMQARRQMELDLRKAITAGEFELYYQPIVSSTTGRIRSFEALIRWNHPTNGRVPPDKFIPLAEELGLIHSIGSWALSQACKDARNWPEDVSVAVNVSPNQFKTADLVESVRRALGASGLQSNRLQLEVTETVLLNNTDLTLSMLHDLRELGVRIAMDDFGSGYSSLNYLRKFPFDKLKIDKSFIDNIANDQECVAIVRAVTDLARTLGIETTAEGVETQEQRAVLRNMGCDEIQGYLISRPQSVAGVRDLLGASALAETAA
ncbi:MAG TPA: EAL domain-containing protein [Hyphomicrobiaceae bacterium]|nr:EAL domain-containing protein [Hyphomicrobiaceae bacterium]